MTEKKLADLIKLADLKNLKHLILFRNDVSAILVLDADKVIIQEIKVKGIVLTLPKNTCGVKHGVTLCFVSLPFDKKVTAFPNSGQFKDSFEVIGKVMEIIPAGNLCTINIEFTQYDVKKWNDFVLLYIKHQKKINELNKKI
jgi:hypothetical protein